MSLLSHNSLSFRVPTLIHLPTNYKFSTLATEDLLKSYFNIHILFTLQNLVRVKAVMNCPWQNSTSMTFVSVNRMDSRRKASII